MPRWDPRAFAMPAPRAFLADETDEESIGSLTNLFIKAR